MFQKHNCSKFCAVWELAFKHSTKIKMKNTYTDVLEKITFIDNFVDVFGAWVAKTCL